MVEKNSYSGRLEQLTKEIKRLPPDQIEKIEYLVKSAGKKALSLKDAAQMLNVSSATLRRAIKSGAIKAFQLSKAGNYRISIEEIDQFMKGEKTR